MAWDGYVGLRVDRCISLHGAAAGTRSSNASLTNAAAFDTRTVAIAAATSRCGSAYVTHDLVLPARHLAVWTFTGQIGIRISSTSALVTSETGRLTMCGKAVVFGAVQPGPGVDGATPGSPLLLDDAGGGSGKGQHASGRGASRIDRTVVLRRTGSTKTTSGTPSTRSAGAPGPDGRCVGGRMAAVSESTSSSPSSAGTVSIGLVGLVGHGASVHLASSSIAAVAPRQASAWRKNAP